MLHRSFKPAKCKTVLKLAMARIKLLRNKKEVVYKQQKKEVAQLLESGDDRTARIRVEHVIREEKTMAAYELIEIYCELIVARLSMIETQKNCPIDLKEAITSVMFASPRCAADIPELVDIRKHFTSKYGKDFVTSAVELRPNAGVNRLLVEKLSATAPDTQTKIKVMTIIAEEHNIKWEPSVGEKDEKPVNDLLSGPKTFENVNKIFVEPPVVQAAPSIPKKQDVPVNHYEQNINSSSHSENYTSAGVGTSKTTPAIPPPEPRPSTNSEGRQREHSISSDRNDFSPGKQSWNMEFKDATSAAQAAAEAAERASMAARAAAELSSRENTRTSNISDSQKPSIPGSQDDCQPSYAESTLRSEDPSKKSGNNSFHGKKDEDDEYNLAAETAKLRSRSKKSSHSASVKESSSLIAEDLTGKSSQKNERYSQMSFPKLGLAKSKSGDYSDEEETAKLRSRSKKSSHAASVKESSSLIAEDLPGKSSQENERYSQMSSPKLGPAKSKSGDYSDEEAGKEKFHEGSRKQDVITSFVEEWSGKQLGGASSCSSTSSDHEKFENDVDPNYFGDRGRGDILKVEDADAEQVQSYDHHDQVFDNSGSDDDKGGFDKDIFSVKTNFFPSPDRETPTHLSESYLFKDADTTKVSISHSESNVLSESDELQRVAFDHSDGPGSESDEEPVQLKHNSSPKKQISPRIVTSQLDFDEINRYSVYDKFDEEKSSHSSTHSSVHETVDIVEASETPDKMKDDFVKLSSFEDNAESSFGVLTGGRRNTPKLPPYNPQRRYSDSSDSDDSVHVQEEQTKKIGTTSAKNQLKVDDTQQTSTNKGRLTSGVVSRRTRAGIADKSSYSDEMRAFLEGSGDGSSGSGNVNEKASFNEQEGSKSRSREQVRPKYEEEVPAREEKLKTSAYEKTRSLEQASPKYEQEVNIPRRAIEKPRSREQVRPEYEEDVITPKPEGRLKTAVYEKPRSREQVRTEYKEELITPKPEGRHKTSAYEKPRSREQVRPEYEEEVIAPKPEGRHKTSAYEKPRSREQVRPEYEEEVIAPKPEGRYKTSAYEKPRSREQMRPEYEEEVITPKPEGRLKTSAYEKPRSREQASTKYEHEVTAPMHDDRLKATVFEKPRSREQQAKPKYEQELNIPAPKCEERPKASVLEKPSSPDSEKPESLKTSTSSEKTPEKEDSIKRASHVHPKLPDFDTIFAQLQSKRSNQK